MIWRPRLIFLTVTTLKDPTKMHSGHHTVEIFTFISHDPFARWADQPTGARDEDYLALKARLSEAMLARVDEIVPGFSEHVVFHELGTPLSNAHYINAYRGNIYGIDKTADQVGRGAFSVTTEIDGLFLCGASTTSHGVAGAAGSGLLAASKILNCRMRDFFAAPGTPLQIYPAEDISQWPPKLQERAARG